jgi:ribonuclease P protein component
MFSFDKSRRLLNKSEYDLVFQQNNKLHTTGLIMLYRFHSQAHARIGFALSKKAIPKACQRNRIKRVLRESFRVANLPPVDVVFLAKKGVISLENQVLRARLHQLWLELSLAYKAS